MMAVKRIYVEKKPEYAVQARELLAELKSYLGLDGLKNVRTLIRYDVENVSDDVFLKALSTVFSEPPVDILYEDDFPKDPDDHVFSVEYLPGQFDQRADSAEQCVCLLKETEEPVIRSATTYVLSGVLTDSDREEIHKYCINPVDSRLTDETVPDTLITVYPEPDDVAVFDGFISMSDDELKKLYDSLGLAMTFADFKHIRNYFGGSFDPSEEKRDPTVTEIRVLDTYWSDHCRHTTFLTELKNITFEDGDYSERVKAVFDEYKAGHDEIYAGRDDKCVTLMDIALLAMKQLKAQGRLDDMEVSDEINACSIIVPVEADYGQGRVTEEWLVFFKNETHNHPTEIEPFGGAATCLGGAIRDPLSGRGYVYQAMRVTGAADPTRPLSETMEGKLPQRKIVTGAASGYSSYGNQIGLATGLVDEIYHPGYAAKRLEIGAVMGAAPRKNVIRENSDPGDIIILMGGRTGRDGIGGATGSSKAHTSTSIDTCGAEVQKGNPPTERKLQRLFRRGEVSHIIKKCNDFGAGGVSVAIGELAPGLRVDLDKVPKKYAGLDGTELAISESQERMAVVVAPSDVDKMLSFAAEENLEAVAVAVVTEEPRLVLTWRGKEIVNISRAFLDTNGAHQETDVIVESPDKNNNYLNSNTYPTDTKEDCQFGELLLKRLSDLNSCSRRGLGEMFDSSIGAGTVTMPYGGKYQLTPIQTMIAKLPVSGGESDVVTMMSYGMDPYLMSWSPFHGAQYAVLESVAKIVASGGDLHRIRFTFQEYFKRMTTDAKRWGEPMAALLGAYEAQMKLGLASIGGKDSMSGTFNDIDVPPTLCSFAVDVADISDIITDEFKEAGHRIVKFEIFKDSYDLPDFEKIITQYEKITTLIRQGVIISAYALNGEGIAVSLAKMAFGNKLGVKLCKHKEPEFYFARNYGEIVAEIREEDLAKLDEAGVVYVRLGRTVAEPEISYRDESVSLETAIESWQSTLEDVFPTHSGSAGPKLRDEVYDINEKKGTVYVCRNKTAKPRVFVPVFPGTNCEYDTGAAFAKAGAEINTVVFRNRTADDIAQSVRAFREALDNSQIVMFSGGFSAGDEPDGSAKFITSVFRNPEIAEAMGRLLDDRDGLVLGICNGFQALIKLGLVPHGKIVTQEQDSPTLTVNHIGRHVSRSVYTKVMSNKSPWFMKAEAGGIYTVPASHGEGRFVASDEWINKLFEAGQVATCYVDADGRPTMDEDYNVNGSYAAIEGITSPDGRILGKMVHSERIGNGVAINLFGNQDQRIFESGVEYFK
ncbi:MAG: phosphoribosylformylglycinamidine synthase [Eubacterium sp.]|nr:phosphoribosylformylglycinamidine synthase [Eubacterium sp.]